MAQNPETPKAPVEVDQALRARVTQFYQALVDGKPRRAEELVADDSKDYFYSAQKSKFLSFELQSIDYSKEFTRAKVQVRVETYFVVMGFGTQPMKVPVLSLWKVEKGLWCWYVTEDFLNTTPFGKFHSSSADGSVSAGLPNQKNLPTLESLVHQVKPDKPGVVLRTSQPSSDQVAILNGMPGIVTLEIRSPRVPGLEVKTDRTTIPAGEKAVLSFHFEPGKNAPTGTVHMEVAVQPVNQVIPLLVTFK